MPSAAAAVRERRTHAPFGRSGLDLELLAERDGVGHVFEGVGAECEVAMAVKSRAASSERQRTRLYHSRRCPPVESSRASATVAPIAAPQHHTSCTLARARLASPPTEPPAHPREGRRTNHHYSRRGRGPVESVL